MKKKWIFLITIIAFLFCGKEVFAQNNTFYEAEYIGNIYMSKYEYASNTIYYQRARFFRDSRGHYAYCIEPFRFFQEGSTYYSTNTPRGLSKEQIERINKIVYFGFGYKGHSDASWYPVTQMMIWKEANPTGGDYYFTVGLNGERTNAFDKMMGEINNLIKNYDNEIPIQNQTITMIEGTKKEYTIGDSLNFYTTENEEVELKDKKIYIKDMKEGTYEITLKRKIEPMSGEPIVMYESDNSQNMIGKGDLNPKEVKFKIKVITNHIDINKIDEDTKTNQPQGEASLDGAIFELYNQENNVIQTIEIKDAKAQIKNLPFGTYYLKEKDPGRGYQKNTNTYEVSISEKNPNPSVQISNKVIEKKIILQKKYGEKGNLLPEKNIDFEIYNSKNEIVKVISTDENGKVEFTLPYGTYRLHQKNSTDGYQKVNPITLQIKDSKEESLELEDYKIPVPNTHTKKQSILWILLQYWLFLC